MLPIRNYDVDGHHPQTRLAAGPSCPTDPAYSAVRGLVDGAQAPHGLPERPVPEPWGMLVAGHGDRDDPGQHLHALVQFLRDPDGAPDRARPGRARPRRGGGRHDGAPALRDHKRRPRRAGRRRAPRCGRRRSAPCAGATRRPRSRSSCPTSRGARRTSTPCSTPGPISSTTTWRRSSGCRSRSGSRPAMTAPAASCAMRRAAASRSRRASCSDSASAGRRSSRRCATSRATGSTSSRSASTFSRPAAPAGRPLGAARGVPALEAVRALGRLRGGRKRRDGALELPRRRAVAQVHGRGAPQHPQRARRRLSTPPQEPPCAPSSLAKRSSRTGSRATRASPSTSSAPTSS